MDITIIIVSYNTKKLLVDCIDSIIKTTHDLDYEIIVVDNASTDGSIEAINIFKKGKKETVKVIKNIANRGFGKANSQGMKKAKGNYILLLNSDTVIQSNVISEMVAFMEKEKDIGIASCALKNQDGSLQGTGGYFPTLIRIFSWMTIQDIPGVDRFIKPFHPMHQKSFWKGEDFYAKKRELDWVTGAFFLIRKRVVKDIGYFDEDYFMYTEETDYCYRAKKEGWKILYSPKWSITHLGGASGKKWSYVIPEFEGVKLFYKKHYPAWQYPILRLLLKIGSLGRILVFGLLDGKEAAATYAKAFKTI